MPTSPNGKGKVVLVEPMKSMLNVTGNKRLKLNCDAVLSKFALKFTSRRYLKAGFQ